MSSLFQNISPQLINSELDSIHSLTGSVYSGFDGEASKVTALWWQAKGALYTNAFDSILPVPKSSHFLRSRDVAYINLLRG
jgi:hypothetical protein